MRGSEFRIKADHIILAIGQKQNFITKKRLDNVFNAGDYKLGATTLINAIGDAKDVARNIDKFLMKRDAFVQKYSIEENKSTNRDLKLNYIPITEMRLKESQCVISKLKLNWVITKLKQTPNPQDAICVIINLKLTTIYVFYVMNACW